MKLSVALAVHNEEAHLDACLSSIIDIADEIVIVDGESTDASVAIAQKYHAKIIHADNILMFHINKQKALEACQGEWIVQLDADERVTHELKQEIKKIIYRDPGTNNQKPIRGFFIPRKNFFFGHWMQKGGQYPDYVIRLVKKGYATFPCLSVHEQISIDGAIGYLIHPLLHYSYKTKEEYWRKADTYTSLTAKDIKKENPNPTFRLWILYTIVKPIQTFISLFFRHKGCMDGWYGFLFAWWSALHFPIAYKKYRSLS